MPPEVPMLFLERAATASVTCDDDDDEPVAVVMSARRI